MISTVWAFIRNNWQALLLSLIPSGMAIAPLPFHPVIYYGMLGCFFIYIFCKTKEFNILMALLLSACTLSILANNPPGVFRCWERLGLFCLVTMVYFPVICLEEMERVRFRALRFSLWISVFIGIGSFICYFLGINYMRNANINTMEAVGWFGGLTPMSMLLGPITAIGCVYLLYVLLFKENVLKKYRLLLFLGCLSCFFCTMLSASRIALVALVIGALALLFFYSKGRLNKFIGITLVLSLVFTFTYPLHSHFSEKVLEKQTLNIKSGNMFSSRQEKWDNRVTEFKNSPLLGIGFCAISPELEKRYMNRQGVVEPGNSWLAVASMTGLIGLIPFILITISTSIRLFKQAMYSDDTNSILLFSLLMVVYVHMMAEGYVLAGGAYMCFFFWLLLGVSYMYIPQKYQDEKLL